MAIDELMTTASRAIQDVLAAVVIPGILSCVAKVMISLPDEFLARVDAQATAHGSTRSATIRELAEVGLGERQRRLAEQMTALEGTAQRHGGNAVRDLKAARPQ